MDRTEVIVAQLVKELAIPPHLKGHKYIKDAVLMTLKDETVLHAITKELYPELAKKNHVGVRSVENGIINAIKLSKASEETKKRILGTARHLSNREYIGELAFWIKLNYWQELEPIAS